MTATITYTDDRTLPRITRIMPRRVHRTSRCYYRSGALGVTLQSSATDGADCVERYARATVDEVAVSCGRDGNQTV
jgi:hypothetical protein